MAKDQALSEEMMVRELRKELAQAKERLRRLKDEHPKNPRQRRENLGDKQLLEYIITILEVRLGIRPSRRYCPRRARKR